MSEQLRLLDVERQPRRLSPATIALGKYWVAECRAVLYTVTQPPTERHHQ